MRLDEINLGSKCPYICLLWCVACFVLNPRIPRLLKCQPCHFPLMVIWLFWKNIWKYCNTFFHSIYNRQNEGRCPLSWNHIACNQLYLFFSSLQDASCEGDWWLIFRTTADYIKLLEEWNDFRYYCILANKLSIVIVLLLYVEL